MWSLGLTLPATPSSGRIDPGVKKLQQCVHSAGGPQLFWGVGLGLTSIPSQIGQSSTKGHCRVHLFDIQLHLHGIQNGSLPNTRRGCSSCNRTLEHHFGSSCLNSCRDRWRGSRVVQSSFLSLRYQCLVYITSQRVPTRVYVPCSQGN